MTQKKWMIVPIMALTLTAFFAACGSDNDPIQPIPAPTPNPLPNPLETPLTSEEQKERLNVIGREFFDMMPTSDFNEIKELTNFIVNNYCTETPEALNDWVLSCLQAIGGEQLPSEVATEYENDVDGVHYHYAVIYNYTRHIYAISQFRAHVAWNGNEWDVVEQNTNDLQFTCPAANGEQVRATLTTSGNTHKVYVGDLFIDAKTTYNITEELYENLRKYEYDLAYLEVPEMLNLTLTKGGKTLLTTTIETDLSSMQGSYFNLSHDAYSVAMNTSVAGYTFNNVRVKAQSNKPNGTQVICNVEKNGKKLLSVTIQGEIDSMGGSWDEEDMDPFELNGANVSQCNIDILGKLQLKASCKDIAEYMELIDDIEEADSEIEAKQYLERANSLMSAEIFYNGTSTRQAYAKLETFEQRFFNSSWWDVVPVICFEDGTSYGILDDSYFNENAFRAVVNTYREMMRDYEKLLQDFHF